ncbi:uncharacterized protein [Asterias amurensis]|uniref:uncharacterized protein n=1 Tax=Asterias amurensis TaxID=7602 RepID=UPI003AB6C618
MGTSEEQYQVELPLRHGQVAFNPTVQFEDEYLSVDSDGRRESDQSVDLRHTTHSLKRQLRLQRCKLALICLLVALLLSSAVSVVVVLVLRKTITSTSGNNSTVTMSTEYEECKSNQYSCAQGECIPARWRCDGIEDCLNKNDEQQCDNFTASTPRSCQMWKEEFQIECPPAGCPFYPICTPTGHWSPVQCTTNNVSCWCVDWATGAAIPGSFVRDTEKEDPPFCEQRPD